MFMRFLCFGMCVWNTTGGYLSLQHATACDDPVPRETADLFALQTNYPCTHNCICILLIAHNTPRCGVCCLIKRDRNHDRPRDQCWFRDYKTLWDRNRDGAVPVLSENYARVMKIIQWVANTCSNTVWFSEKNTVRVTIVATTKSHSNSNAYNEFLFSMWCTLLCHKLSAVCFYLHEA